MGDKFIKLFAGAVLAFFLAASPAFAGFVVQEDGVQKGIVEKLNVTTGLDATVTGKTVVVSANGSQTISGGTIDGATIGGTTPGAGSFSSLVAGGLAGAANTWKYVANGFEFEGTTLDAFEATVNLLTDPTADVTIKIPSLNTGNLMISTLATNDVDAANSAWFESGSLVFEGATSDGFEGRLTASDWTADRVHTLPDMTGAVFMSTLATNNFDAANSVWGASNGLVFEGATADAFETTLAPADPLADQTVTIPNTTGAASTMEVKGATVVITAGTTPTLTVPVGVDFIATDTIITDNQDQTITFSSGGTVGQHCTLVFQTDSGGSNDEVITLHTTLTNTTGTLTLANLTANRYTINLTSDGTVWNEDSRTGAQT